MGVLCYSDQGTEMVNIFIGRPFCQDRREMCVGI